jgi:hypothetical protein
MYWFTGIPLTGVGVELGFVPFSFVVYDDCDESVFFFLFVFFGVVSAPLEGGTVTAV